MKLDKNLRVPVTTEQEERIKKAKAVNMAITGDACLRRFYHILMVKGLEMYEAERGLK
jgi:hypothetical protein